MLTRVESLPGKTLGCHCTLRSPGDQVVLPERAEFLEPERVTMASPRVRLEVSKAGMLVFTKARDFFFAYRAGLELPQGLVLLQKPLVPVPFPELFRTVSELILDPAVTALAVPETTLRGTARGAFPETSLGRLPKPHTPRRDVYKQ